MLLHQYVPQCDDKVRLAGIPGVRHNSGNEKLAGAEVVSIILRVRESVREQTI